MLSMMGVMTERVLAPGARSLDRLADFSRWMMAEQKRVFLLCYRLLGDRDEADMAAQDAFLKAHQALQKQVEVEDASKWLTRIAVNTCLDRLRSRVWRFWRRRPAQEDEGLILAAARTREPSSEDQVFAGEIQRRLEDALGRLSARQRAVFTLKHYQEHSLQEIGEILGLDTGTVKAHMARALVKLRTELRDLYGIGGKEKRS